MKNNKSNQTDNIHKVTKTLEFEIEIKRSDKSVLLNITLNDKLEMTTHRSKVEDMKHD